MIVSLAKHPRQINYKIIVVSGRAWIATKVHLQTRGLLKEGWVDSRTWIGYCGDR